MSSASVGTLSVRTPNRPPAFGPLTTAAESIALLYAGAGSDVKSARRPSVAVRPRVGRHWSCR